MKNIKNKIITLVSFLSIFFVNYSYSQSPYFSPPTTSDLPFGVGSTQPRNTGNDILEYNGDIYRVCVWEPTGTSFGIGWKVNSSVGYTTLSLTSAMGDPDVCLVQSGGTVYAIVVYYDTGNSEWDLEVFEWTGSVFNSVSFGAFDSGNFGTSVNIDGNAHVDGQFAVVWDHSNGDIYAGVGDITSFFSIFSNVQAASGHYPDVSIYYDGSSDIVHIAYIDLGTGDLMIDDHDFSTLAMGSTGPYGNIFTVTPTKNFYYPRIASPNGNNSSSSEWTVVVEDIDSPPSFYLITGFNNGSTTPIYYNFVTSTPFADLTSVPNFYTSVTYDSNYPSDGIWVGWQWDNTGVGIPGGTYSGMVDDAGYSIVLKCDNTANPISSTYWQVPNGIVQGDLSGFLSLSGRYANDELFLTYVNFILNSNSVDAVYIKNVSPISSATELRIANNVNQSSTILDDLYKNPTNESFHFSLYDLTGKKLLNFSGTKTEILNFIKASEDNIPTSLYLARIISADGNNCKSGKLFVGK